MNPLLQQALGSIVRWLLAFAAGILVQHGIWSQDASGPYLEAATLAILGLGWSIWQKYKSRIHFLTALEMPAGVTEAKVKDEVAKGMGATLAILLVAGLIGTPSCVKAPPNLTPAGAAAFHATRVVRALDVLVDFAIAAEAQNPKLLSTDNTRKVVTFVVDSVKVIGVSPGGWKPVVTAGLVQLEHDLPPADWSRIAPYVQLLRVLIAEVA